MTGFPFTQMIWGKLLLASGYFSRATEPGRLEKVTSFFICRVRVFHAGIPFRSCHVKKDMYRSRRRLWCNWCSVEKVCQTVLRKWMRDLNDDVFRDGLKLYGGNVLFAAHPILKFYICFKTRPWYCTSQTTRLTGSGNSTWIDGSLPFLAVRRAYNSCFHLSFFAYHNVVTSFNIEFLYHDSIY